MQDSTNHQPKIHAYLAHLGLGSRRKVEELIGQGKVEVNGLKAHIGQRVAEGDQIKVDGQLVNDTQQEKRYILINKPVGYVSTTSDELGRPTVLDFLQEKMPKNEVPKDRLYPVGRLDLDSEGLMLLTNDGDLTHHLTHPSFIIDKTYLVRVAHRPTDNALNHLRKGVRLKEGYTHSAVVEVVPEHELEKLTGYAVATRPETDKGTWLTITIHEGRHRQVRRMLERIGYPVTRLIRISLGKWKLTDLKGKPYLNNATKS